MAKGAYINDLDQIQIHLIYNKLKQMQKRVSAADVQAHRSRNAEKRRRFDRQYVVGSGFFR